MFPKVFKLRAFRQTSAIFLTVQKKVKQYNPAPQTYYIFLRWVAHGIISWHILFIVHVVKYETTKSKQVNPKTSHCTCILASRRVTFFTAVLKYGDHVQNNHSNLLPRASFHHLTSSNLPICFKVKSDGPWRSRMIPKVLKLRAFRQTSVIFLTVQKK